MTALDMLHSLVALVLGGSLFVSAVARWPEEERRVAVYCWLAHAVSAFVIVAIYRYYYHGGDLVYYFRQGQFLADYVEYDVAGHLPELLKLLVQRPVELPVTFFGAGSSTGSMVAVGGIIGLVTSSLWAASVVVSTLTAVGQALLWRGLRAFVPPERRRVALRSSFLVPSVVFWSSSLLKEAFAMLGLGLTLWGVAEVRRQRHLVGGMAAAVGAGCIGLFKPYVLFPLVVAVCVYYYWLRAASRGGVRLRPVPLMVGGVLLAGGMLALGELFPAYSLDSVADSIEQQQMASLTTAGGSDFRVGDTSSQRGLVGFIAAAPLTIITALLRPALIEVRNPLMLANSLETTAALYWMIKAYRRVGRARLVTWAWRSPDIVASIVFVLLFGLAVGLATTNLGTLSRYRLPMMPFYFYIILGAQALSPREARSNLGAVAPAQLASGGH